MPKGRFAKDLTGQTFGLLTVARRAPNYISKTGQEAVWHCHCECGNELDVRAGQLRSGHTKSCGCFQKKGRRKIQHRSRWSNNKALRSMVEHEAPLYKSA